MSAVLRNNRERTSVYVTAGSAAHLGAFSSWTGITGRSIFGPRKVASLSSKGLTRRTPGMPRTDITLSNATTWRIFYMVYASKVGSVDDNFVAVRIDGVARKDFDKNSFRIPLEDVPSGAVLGGEFRPSRRPGGESVVFDRGTASRTLRRERAAESRSRAINQRLTES